MGQRFQNLNSAHRETMWLSSLVKTFGRVERASDMSCDNASRADMLSRLQRSAFSFAAVQNVVVRDVRA